MSSSIIVRPSAPPAREIFYSWVSSSSSPLPSLVPTLANQGRAPSLNSIDLAQLDPAPSEPSWQLIAIKVFSLDWLYITQALSGDRANADFACLGATEGTVLLCGLAVGGERGGFGRGGEVGGKFVGWGGGVGFWCVVNGAWRERFTISCCSFPLRCGAH